MRRLRLIKDDDEKKRYKIALENGIDFIRDEARWIEEQAHWSPLYLLKNGKHDKQTY